MYDSILSLKMLGREGIQKAKYITQSVSQKPWLEATTNLYPN